MAEQFNLLFKRGDTELRTIYFIDEDNAPIDITGWTIFFTVKENITDEDSAAKISKTITEHTAALNGETTLELSPSDTDLIGTYIYDIQIKKSTGEIKTILEGSVVFTRDITIRES